MNDKTLIERLDILIKDDHERGCQGRYFFCTCGYDNDCSQAMQDAKSRIEALEANNARLRLALQNTVEAVAIWAKKPLQETRQRNPSDQASWDQIAAVVGAMVDAALENSDGR